MQFQYPQAFWLLLLLPVFVAAYWLYLKWKAKKNKVLGSPKLVEALLKNYSPQKAAAKFGILLLAFTLGCLALANPRIRQKGVAESRKGIDVMIALDVSNSMLANDVWPNRLQAAKNLISQLSKKLQNDRLGLVLFAGNAYVQVPLTFDADAVTMFTATASPSQIKAQGTAINDALEKSFITFDNQSERFNAIILITDGETHDEDAVKTAQQLSDEGIMINTIGIGSVQGATIIDTVTNTARKDAAGETIITRLNEETLQQIAQTSQGIYMHYSNAENVADQLVQQLSKMGQQRTNTFSQASFQSFYIWLLLPMLLLLVADVFISNKKNKTA